MLPSAGFDDTFGDDEAARAVLVLLRRLQLLLHLVAGWLPSVLPPLLTSLLLLSFLPPLLSLLLPLLLPFLPLTLLLNSAPKDSSDVAPVE